MKTTLPEPPMTVLLGLPFHDITLEETLAYCAAAMHGKEPSYLVTANVDFTTQAYEDPDLKKIVFFADRVVCDGMPLVWLSKWFGHPLRERVAGSDMVPKLLEICGKERHSVFFFGSDLNTLEEAKIIVEKRYPGLKVVGIDSPPFGAVVEWDNDALCAKMRASGAQLLLVCLGCPKQERWIFAHYKEAGIPLSIGVGASLDFITGKQKRAPRWMQKVGMEWFWRMASSPKRLVKRYSKDFVFLAAASWQQYQSHRHRMLIADPAQSSPKLEEERKFQLTRVYWAGNLQLQDLAGAPIPENMQAPVLLDASGITFMDSSGLGRFAALVRTCRTADQQLVVVNPSLAFKTAIRAVRMDSLYQTADTEADALKLIALHRSSGGSQHIDKNGIVWVTFNRALDALYHDEMMQTLETAIAQAPEMGVLVVDLKDVTFIDSRAVGGLIRTWKMVSAKGGKMFLAEASPAVREIISLLRLDKVLAEWKGELPA